MHSAKGHTAVEQRWQLQLASRLCAAPSLRVPRTRLQRYSLCSRLRPTRPMSPRRPAQSTRSVLSPIVRPTPLTRPWPVEPPTVPFPIIPIDISSTWVCPWCFVGVVPTGVAFRQSHVRHRAGLSRRDVPRETIHALQCDKGTNVHVKHPVAEHEAKRGSLSWGRAPADGRRA